MEKSSTPLEFEATDDALLDRLRSVSDQKVDSAARSVNRFSEDDEAHEKRWAKSENRRTLHKIRRWSFWCLFWIGCATAVAVTGGYLFLVYLWIGNVVWGSKVANPEGLHSLVTNVFWTILVIMATLFAEGVFKDKED